MITAMLCNPCGSTGLLLVYIIFVILLVSLKK